MPPKSVNKSAPKTPKSAQILIEPPDLEENVEIKLTITQLGNFTEPIPNNQGFEIDAICFSENVQKDIVRNHTFHPCGTKLTHKVDYVWIFRPKNLSVDTIWELASKPLLLKIISIEKCSQKDIEDRRVIGYCAVSLGELFTNSMGEVKRTERITDAGPICGPDLNTWPKRPFITYMITLGDYQFAEEQDFQTLSISFECLLHPLAEWLPTEVESYLFEIGLNIPLAVGKFKQLKIQNGLFVILKNAPQMKTTYNWGTLPEVFHETLEPIDRDLKSQGLLIPRDFNIIAEFQNSTVLNFQQLFQTKIPKKSLKYIVEQRKLIIEVLITPTSPSLDRQIKHFLGVVPVEEFGKVDTKTLKFGVPLFKYHPKLYQQFPTPESPIFASPLPKETKPVPIKKGKRASKMINPVPIVIAPEYLTDGEGYNVCVVIQIEVDQPLFQKVQVDSSLEKDEETRRVALAKTHTKKLEDNFTGALFEFIKDYKAKEEQLSYVRHRTNLVTIDDVRVGSEKNLLEAGMNLVAKSLKLPCGDKRTMDNAKEEAFISVVTKLNEIMNVADENRSDMRKFRIQCGMELFELGYQKDAQDFFVLNITESPADSDVYIDYAIFNLFTMDIGKAQESCKMALKQNPDAVMAILLSAYIHFMSRDYSTAETLLFHLTKTQENFAEAWMALYLVYSQENKKCLLKFVEEGLLAADSCPLITAQHNTDEFLWAPKPCVDPKLRALMKFLQWGCIGFAEIGLGMIIHNYQCDSYEFSYHMALVHYHKRDYASTLRRLRHMNRYWQNVDCMRLKAHCLLNEGNIGALEILRDIVSRSHDKRYNLILLKIGKFYLDIRKYRTARFYLKKACRRYRTFAALKMLAFATFKCQNYNIAELCCIMMYDLNPYNSCSFPGLSRIYCSKRLLPQHEYCAGQILEKRSDHMRSNDSKF